MYHHRYQPHPSNLASRNSSAFVSNISPFGSNKNSSSAISSYQNSTQNKPPSSVDSSLTSAPALAAVTSPPTAIADSTTHPKSSSSGSGIFSGVSNHRTINSASTHSSPFSSLPKQFVEERQDVIFRRVRGILNKITPETFEKLTNELVNVGLDSPRTLRGVIYLLFDKALKDLKYSSLYAKLCQELSEKAPNFERELEPNTFCKFLISKCEDEFEKRRKATEDFDSKNELTDEEFEQRAIAKQKMLGNIKFICELGKKRLLQEEILHECIRGLLSKKKKEKPIQDQAQDLECLCQIMRTIGSLLDIEASKNLMDQYFERIDMFSRKPELPSRIRFMLRDVIDLRMNKWKPRPFQREDNVPQPLSKLREELGFKNSNPSAPMDKSGTKNLNYINDLSKLSGTKLNSLLLDDEPSFTTTTDFHWGSPFLSDEPTFDIFSDTVPNAKVGSATNSITRNISLTKPSKPQSSTTDVSKLGSPGTRSMTDTFINRSMNNRIDPFSDSFKSKPGPNNNTTTNNHNHGDRRSSINDGNHVSNFGKRKDVYHDIDTKNAISEPVSSQHNKSSYFGRVIDDKNTTSTRSERVYNTPKQFRGNTTHNNESLDVRRSSPVRNDHLPRYTDRVQFEDSPRPPTSHRRLDSSNPDFRQPAALPQTVEMMPPHPLHPLQSNLSSQPQHSSNINQQNISAEINNRFDTTKQYQNFGSTADRMDHKDRRFVRSTSVNEPRQPKFSGASNYKLPGRDRHLPAPPILRDRVPESELSQDWRADSLANTLKPSKNASKHSAPAQKMTQSKSKDISEYKLDDVDSKINGPNHIIDSNLNEERNSSAEVVLIDRIITANQERADTCSPMNRSTVPACSGNTPNGLKNEREQSGSQKPNDDVTKSPDKGIVINRDTISRRNHDSRRAAPHPPSFQSKRSTNKDFNAKQDVLRRQAGPPIEFDGRVFQRHHQNESASLERRNFKPAMPRNQSFDAPSNNDSRKTQTWRKNGPTNSSSILKDITPSILTNSILPKTPLRTTDSDFSLRPSHNLAGRTTSASSTQTQKPNPPIVLPSTRFPVVTQIAQSKPDTKEQKSEVTQEQKARDSSVAQAKSFGSELKARGNQSKSESISDRFTAMISSTSGGNESHYGKVITEIKELKVPKPNQTECLIGTLKYFIVKSDNDRAILCKILSQLIPSIMDVTALIGAFQAIFEQMQGMEIETPRVKSLVASTLGQATVDNLVTISDVASLLHGGKHHPMFLLYLQKLEKLNGKAWLSEKFSASKINLMDMLPEVDRSKDRLAMALKDRCLGFLDPMLTIEPDLWEQMRDRDPTPAAIYRWIKDNVDQSIQNTTTFAQVFVRCLLRHIHSTSMDRVTNMTVDLTANDGTVNIEPQSNKSSPVSAVLQALSEHEKELLSKYQHILQAILKDKQMQLASLYALQTFYYSLDFPKGALVRWFHLLYDMSIVDDDVYFTWKEEINDKYPGKGQALFQVNTWLNWLAESDEEDEDDDED